MVFSSPTFLYLFLPAAFLVNLLFRRSVRWSNVLLLLASLLFYAWGEPVCVLLMLITTLANYLAARAMARFPAKRRFWCGLAVVWSIGTLVFFKYTDFLIENLNGLFGLSLPLPHIALPIGISFFTFQAMSYVLDVYRGDARLSRNYFDVLLYIALFPQLIAGPIVKYHDVDEQLRQRVITVKKTASGFRRFCFGLAKKVLIANQVAVVADRAFNLGNGELSASFAWLGAICYTLQIYYDFSGYSDMAIGLGKMFGFHFLENFNYPYISKSITEFWRRWHISLSACFRDYVYFPLGGSRVSSKWKHIRNLFVVWLLTGVWHGANWTFIVWGLLYFVLLVLEKYGHLGRGWPVWLNWLFTLLMVNFAWVIFRADSLGAAGQYLLAMFGGGAGAWSELTALYLRENWTVLLAGLVFAAPVAPRLRDWLVRRDWPMVDLLYALGAAAVFLVSAAFIIKGTYNPFIYFNF